MTVIVLNFHHRSPNMYDMPPWVSTRFTHYTATTGQKRPPQSGLLLPAPGRGGGVLWWACLSVCLRVCLSASAFPELYVRSSPNFCCRLHVIYDPGSVLLWRRCDRLCISGFMDSIISARNGPYGGMSTPLRRVTSLRRRAQANAAAASYWLRRVSDDGGRRDYRWVHRAKGAVA